MHVLWLSSQVNVARPGPETIRARGDGLKSALVGCPARFEVLLGECDPDAEFSVDVVDGHLQPVEYREISPQEYSQNESENDDEAAITRMCFEYTPRSPSDESLLVLPHAIAIQFEGEHIKGSPFKVLVQKIITQDILCRPPGTSPLLLSPSLPTTRTVHSYSSSCSLYKLLLVQFALVLQTSNNLPPSEFRTTHLIETLNGQSMAGRAAQSHKVRFSRKISTYFFMEFF